MLRTRFLAYTVHKDENLTTQKKPYYGGTPRSRLQTALLSHLAPPDNGY